MAPFKYRLAPRHTILRKPSCADSYRAPRAKCVPALSTLCGKLRRVHAPEGMREKNEATAERRGRGHEGWKRRGLGTTRDEGGTKRTRKGFRSPSLGPLSTPRTLPQPTKASALDLGNRCGGNPPRREECFVLTADLRAFRSPQFAIVAALGCFVAHWPAVSAFRPLGGLNSGPLGILRGQPTPVAITRSQRSELPQGARGAAASRPHSYRTALPGGRGVFRSRGARRPVARRAERRKTFLPPRPAGGRASARTNPTERERLSVCVRGYPKDIPPF